MTVTGCDWTQTGQRAWTDLELIRAQHGLVLDLALSAVVIVLERVVPGLVAIFVFVFVISCWWGCCWFVCCHAVHHLPEGLVVLPGGQGRGW